jgi:hypothetical protein
MVRQVCRSQRQHDVGTLVSFEEEQQRRRLTLARRAGNGRSTNETRRETLLDVPARRRIAKGVDETGDEHIERHRDRSAAWARRWRRDAHSAPRG